jgi:hypothetical protein
MNNRRTILTVIATALIALCLPVLASAQGSYDPYGRNRDNRDYRRDGDYGRDNGYGRYDSRSLRDAARRVNDRSKDFQRHLDDALDHSRYDGSRREDRINETAREFHNAADDFKDRIGNGRDLNRAEGEARRLLQLGQQIDRFASRNQLDSRSSNDWSQIRQDLRLIADAYGYSFNGNDGYNRDNGGYRRNDDRNRRRDDNVPWWQRLPRP